MKMSTGDYQVDCYNKWGFLVGTPVLAVSLMQAHEKAAAACEQNTVVTSYTVIRLVFNSLDEPPWCVAS